MISNAICRAAISAVAIGLLAGCTRIAVVDDHLETNGVPSTEFSADTPEVTLSARFGGHLPADERFMVEWLFPDDRIYLRKPVRRSATSDDMLETSMPIRGKAPGRHPGVWQVRLRRDGETLVSRYFEIYAPGAMATGARDYAGSGLCGTWRWSDAAINGHRPDALAPRTPGAWIGGRMLDSSGEFYAGMVLLTSCAPG